MTCKTALQDWFKNYVGIEYADRGREGKFDCWGLVRYIYKNELNIDLPSFDEYESAENIQSVALVLDEHHRKQIWIPISEGKEKPFDIAVFKINRYPVHTGIVIGGGKMIHIEKGINASLCVYNGLRWKNRLFGFFRHEELNDV